MKMSPEAKKAVKIGSLCTISYLAVYVARNILGAVSPQMIEAGVFSTAEIGTLSSVYFVTYAIGQLINGAIGDRIKSKYMIGFGLLLSGAGNIAFALLAGRAWITAAAIYGSIGFFLSMIHSPMAKTVAENTELIYATRCSVGYTFASLVGSPAAGLLAAFLVWKGAFGATSGFLITMGMIVLVVFSIFERKGIIDYTKHKKKAEEKGSVRALIEHRIIVFALVAALTGVIRTTVIFWLPTYFAQHLGFSSSTSAELFTVITLAISFSAPVAIILFERLFKRSIDRAILTFFCCAAAGFLGTFLARQPVINIVCIMLSIFCSNMASNILWSAYCPSLRDTGATSSGTGFLDFISYMAAAGSSKLFANAVDRIGWSPLILIWLGLMICGVLLFLPYQRLTRAKNVVE